MAAVHYVISHALVNECLFKTVGTNREKVDDCHNTTCISSTDYVPPTKTEK